MISQKVRSKEDLTFPEFDDIKVSTKTFTAMTNLRLEIKELYEKLPITEYTVIPKKRGRKKKCEIIDPNKDIQEGSIITLKFEGEVKGVELKVKKDNKKTKWFRNSITVVIVLDKPVNFKICRNGTFQMTGCKCHIHAELCIKYIWEYIKNDPTIYSFSRGSNLECLFIPSMRNIDFSLGFIVDREKLNQYMCPNESNKQSYNDINFHCLLETSFGYTGVNIKIPLNQDISKMGIKKLTYTNKNQWNQIDTTYQEYLDLLPLKEKESKLKEERYNTFLVFHSGKVIMSGLTSEFMKDVYYYFLKIMKEGFDYIEERLDI
jgi:TATA-box binding protein (TBP) (component of TFIID and TFIIIB)